MDSEDRCTLGAVRVLEKVQTEAVLFRYTVNAAYSRFLMAFYLFWEKCDKKDGCDIRG